MPVENFQRSWIRGTCGPLGEKKIEMLDSILSVETGSQSKWVTATGLKTHKEDVLQQNIK